MIKHIYVDEQTETLYFQDEDGNKLPLSELKLDCSVQNETLELK